MGFQSITKIGRVSDDVTSSGRSFHVRAAATSKVRLPIVDSLNVELPDDWYWQNAEHADLVHQTHGKAGPDNVEQSHEELCMPSWRSYIECAPERAASVN